MRAEEFEQHRRELEVHCYRMLGSYHEAEDLVQETFLKAWRGREDFEGRASVRSWLYRIATNACLDVLKSGRRRVLPVDLGPPADPQLELPPRTDVAWLEPVPDRVLDETPEAALVAKETVELAFLAALQHLPARQRAVLIVRDVLGWPADRTAELLEISVPAANSALQRARATLRQRLPERGADWAPDTPPDRAEQEVARRYAEAFQRADIEGMARLLADDARAAMPPLPMWYVGKPTIVVTLWQGAPHLGEIRTEVTRANRAPAIVSYRKAPGDDRFRPFAIGVLRVEAGLIVEMTAFHDPAVFEFFADRETAVRPLLEIPR
ncbi:sigma-70 family RNA polymerase sigma factor [Dactylosporangium fulvum]|uniref:RNA polymerase sigma factor n=1 Tax=Dactylosporangium fulvum TaxID=53359 RepID=A0ABY5VWM4_9ACTN|nr:RNA polymerase subunit sigma-70 [Dactylosporangium fulvum]UWP82128.1 RNA polymerase subunit sigma-70 [Dactylosporangium fulvum]